MNRRQERQRGRAGDWRLLLAPPIGLAMLFGVELLSRPATAADQLATPTPTPATLHLCTTDSVILQGAAGNADQTYAVGYLGQGTRMDQLAMLRDPTGTPWFQVRILNPSDYGLPRGFSAADTTGQVGWVNYFRVVVCP